MNFILNERKIEKEEKTKRSLRAKHYECRNKIIYSIKV